MALTPRTISASTPSKARQSGTFERHLTEIHLNRQGRAPENPLSGCRIGTAASICINASERPFRS